MKSNILVTLLLLVCVTTIMAQVSGKIDNKYAGISFTIPEGWFGQVSENVLVLGSNTEAGLMLVMEHDYTSEQQLKQEADKGINEEGFYLSRTSAYEKIGTNGVGAEFAGSVQGSSAKAYLVSLINSYGTGLTIMAMTTTEMYSSRYKELALGFAKSIIFSKPVIPPIVNEWQEGLKNTKLTYRSSYNSGGYGDSYGGMSEREEIHLCAAGYFKYSSSSSLTIDTGGASGYSAGKDGGAGKWEVTGDGSGGAALKLRFDNGNIRTYTLSFEDGKTFLNGKRYFRTGVQDDPQYRPDCY